MPRKYGLFAVGHQTFGVFLEERWNTMCEVLMLPRGPGTVDGRQLRALLPPWGSQRMGPVPTVPSYVSEDGFPAEFSVNWSGAVPEVRAVFDCSPGPLESGGRDFPAGQHLADAATGSRRFHQVRDVFLTPDRADRAAPLWHSLAWRPGHPAEHKAYFGLFHWDVPTREAAVQEAMRRLGLSDAWSDARHRIATLPKDWGRREVEFFALDLSATGRARVKVYYRNHDTAVTALERVAATAVNHDAARALHTYRTLLGPGRDDAGEAPLTCLSFRAGQPCALEATTYLRMPSLTSSDLEAAERIARLLQAEGLDAGRYLRLVRALAPGPLHECEGIQELVSYRAAGVRCDVTTYFRFSVYPHPAPVPTVRPYPVAARP